MLGKQAKIVTDKQVRAVFAEIGSRRYPLRDRLMFLLSIKAGMRAKEIASVTWGMVTDAEGEIADVIALENRASKGKGGGRHIPMHPDVKAAFVALHRERDEQVRSDWPVIHSERDRGLSAGAEPDRIPRITPGLRAVGLFSPSRQRTFFIQVVPEHTL